MELYLVRHGECEKANMAYFDAEKNYMDQPLTAKGQLQAARLAERLKSVSFDAVYASDLKRAQETAERLLNALTRKPEYVIDKHLREIDMGDVLKTSWDGFPEQYEKWKLHEEDVPYPNGESGTDVWNRCGALTEELLQSPGERIAVVCHGGVIRSLVCGLFGIPQVRRFLFGMPLENCSITVVKQESGQRYLHTFNDHGHLIGI